MPKEKVILPEVEALIAAMEVAERTEEGVKYVVNGFRTILTEGGLLEKYKEMTDKVDEWAKGALFKLQTNEQPWLGETPSSAFAKSKANFADEAAEQLRSMNVGTGGPEVALHFAINEQAQFRRGYASDGNQADQSTVEALDKIYFDWLAKNNFGTENGIVYETLPNGDIKLEKRADPKAFRDLLMGSRKGAVPICRPEGHKSSM